MTAHALLRRRSRPALPALAAILALLGWAGTLRAATPSLDARLSAIPVDVGPLAERLVESLAGHGVQERATSGGPSSPAWLPPRDAGLSAVVGAGPAIRRSAPEGLALRALERSGRLGAPATAPPLPS